MLKEPTPQVWKEFDRSLVTPVQKLQLEATGHTHLSRNSACLCGSGKRLKNCCYTGL